MSIDIKTTSVSRSNKVIMNILKYISLFISGGLIYMSMELLWRQYTHWTMGIAGGILLILIGLIDEVYTKDLPILIQSTIASIIITIIEYYAGIIINVKLHLNVWDYSQLPFNVDGQVCLYFSLIWFVVGAMAVIIDNYLRWKLFGEPFKKIRLI